jgi:parallel beta-helix repeat protein
MKKLLTLLLAMIAASCLWAQSLTVTYTAGDIPTDQQSPWVGPSTCPGEITVTIPAGNWITGIDVAYDMTAQNGAYMSEQRSRLYSPTTMSGEDQYYTGVGGSIGTFSYNRTGINFANMASGNVVIQMDAGRTWGSTAPNDGCGTYYNKVDNNTWTMTVYYTPIPSCPAPFALTATNLTINSADLGWSTAGSETMWNIKYGAPGFNPLTEGTLVADVTTNPYNLTGLIPLTNYEFYVQANCGGGDLSDWGGPGAFQTPSATISGVYTINSALPTTGSNFNNFSDLATALNTGGLDGPLTANVVVGSGPYNEQIMIGDIIGSSAVNTITINGNGETLEYLSTNTNDRATLKLDGTDYVTVNNLVVKALGSVTGEFGWAVWLTNGADYNSFFNCDFIADQSATSINFAALVTSNSATSATTAGLAASYLTVQNCTTIGGYYGMIINGPTSAPFSADNVITDNEIKDFYLYGLYLRGQNNSLFENNEISRSTRTVLSTFYGIYMASDMSGTVITKNRVFDQAATGSSTSTSYGFYGTGVTATPGPDLLITNNLVYGFGGMNGTQYGMYLLTTNNVQIYHNTISLDNIAHTGTSLIRGIHHSGNAALIDIRNNIISVTSNSTGIKYCLYFAQTAANLPALTSNNNVLHMGATAGTNHIAFWNGAGGPSFTTLADWQVAGFDLNSVDADPLFTMPAMGNMMPQNPDVNNIGADLLAIVPDDFFGVARTITPDPGAIEFSPPSCLPVSNVSADNITTISASIAWTPGGAETLWNLKYGAPGFDPETEGTLISGITSNPYTLSGLDPATFYSVFIQSDCGGGDVGSWGGPVVFVTNCVAFDVPIFEDFNTASPPLLPVCWSNIVFHPTSSFPYCETTTLTVPYSDPVHIRMYNSATFNADAVVMLISPQIAVPLNTLQVNFWAKSGSSVESLLIGTMSDPTDAATFVQLTSIPLTATYEYYSYTLDSYVGTNEYIAFRHANSVATRYIYLDDIEIRVPPIFYSVNFGVVGANGTLVGEVDGVLLIDGDIVEEGSQVLFTATPDANYQIKEWKLNGVLVPGHTAPTYTIADLQENVNVTVEFEMISHAVTFGVVGLYGTLDAAVGGVPILSGDLVNQTSDIVFTATPDQDYRVKEWKQDGVVVPGHTDNVYTVQNLMAPVDVTVEFEEIPILPGDANGDGIIDVLDVTTIVAYIMGQNPDPFIFGAADVNGDGEINVLDIILTVNIILDAGGKTSRVINSLPADLILGDGLITLSSDGTLAGLQFEMNGWNRQFSNLQLALPGFEFVYTLENGILKGMIFSMNGSVIPQGALELITYEGKSEELQWNNAFGGNSNGERVQINTRDMFNRIEQLYEISAYPNPARENFAAVVYVPVASRINVKAIDANGHEYLIVREAVVEAGSSRYRSNVAGSLLPGTYILQLNAEPLRIPGTSIRKEVRIVVL